MHACMHAGSHPQISSICSSNELLARWQDRGSEEYRRELALLHNACARRLVRLCQSNGGVYVKAAQLLSTAQTIPVEYRT